MPIWYKIGAVGALIAILVGWHWVDKRNAVQGALEAQRAIHTALVQQEVIQAQEISNSLLNAAIQDLNKKDEEIKAINTKLSSAISKLQQRTSRKDNPPTSSNTTTCTGAELYREDGEFLIRE